MAEFSDQRGRRNTSMSGTLSRWYPVGSSIDDSRISFSTFREGSRIAILAALILLTGYEVTGAQGLLIFGESGEVDWSAGVPRALGSAYLAAWLVSSARARVWVYRLLIVVVSIIHLLMVDSTQYLQLCVGRSASGPLDPSYSS